MGSMIVQVSVSYIISRDALLHKNFEFTTSATNLKRDQVISYLTSKENNLRDLATGHSTSGLYKELEVETNANGTVNTSSEGYSVFYNHYVGRFSSFISTYNFDDIYFISKRGQILFSVRDKKNLGAFMTEGRFKATPLARTWKDVCMSGRSSFVDFEPFAISGNTYTLFVSVPVYINDNLVGNVVGLIPDKSIDEIVNQQFGHHASFETFIVGIGNNKQVEYRSNPKSIKAQIGQRQTDDYIETSTKKGEQGQGEFTDKNDELLVASYAPINIDGLSWMVFTVSPQNENMEESFQLIKINIFFSLIMIIAIIIIGYYLANKISRPMVEINDKLVQLGSGILPAKSIGITSRSEIGKIQVAFNKLIDGMRGYIEFANKIGRNELDATYEKLSDNDELGASLLSMQHNLVETEENAALRKKEEEKQKWMTEGIAHFGDILRKSYEDMEGHGFNIISNLVNFVNATQGGIFIQDMEKSGQLELLASFAYGRRKYLKKTFEKGEGLIGACFTECETINMTNIPDNFPEITSGLGGTVPKNVLMVPLKVDEEALGVLELISLRDFEPHEIQFVEKIAENIASSINASQISNRTKQLLEESKNRSEQLAAQEEEMRQNMEELHATQEESHRRELETTALIDIINACSLVIELDTDGKIAEVNSNICDLFSIPSEKLVGTAYSAINPKIANDDLWSSIMRGEAHSGASTISVNGKTLHLKEYYAATFNAYYEATKVYVIIQDITKEYAQS